MVKYQFGKNWNWCDEIKSNNEIKERHLDTVYRIDANICQLGKCKTNCSLNPYCLNGLGEKKLTNLLQKDSALTLERSEFFRDKEDYAGLVNLGATCYINTYLQVWYNNPLFRESILNIVFPDNDYDSDKDEIIISTASTVPTCSNKTDNKDDTIPNLKFNQSRSIPFNLQLIFTLLKKSIRKSIDPNFFIKALGLDENMQQDAQEFSQLFLTMLENKLSKSVNGEAITKNLFQGEYSYITECSSCKRNSVRKSNFLELSLNIQNCGTIFECLDDLLKEETMDGDNQYFCEDCNSKRDAKRFIKITDLPRVLNLQLLRFVYDRNSGTKKKLSNKIKFPEILDLSNYKTDKRNFHKTTNTDEQLTTYHLGAILMHVGKSAYSGHYMAQIKNFETTEWFSFNDESIHKIKKKQQLGCTEDEIEKQKAKTSDNDTNTENASTPAKSNESLKNSKSFSTSNAYLLVYYRKDLVTSSSFSKKSERASNDDESTLMGNEASKCNEIVELDNKELETWFEKLKITKTDQRESQNSERTIVRSIYNSLWCNSVDDGKYFMNTNFIRKLLSNQTGNNTAITSPEMTSKYLCLHRRMNPFAVNRFKLISKEGLDCIVSNYGYKLNEMGAFDASSKETTMCQQCVVYIFDYLKLKDKIKDDVKHLKSLLKINESDYLNLNENHAEANGGGVSSKNSDIIVLDDDDDGDDDYSNSKSISPSSLMNNIALNTKRLYWIGKDSIKTWSNIAVKRAEIQLPASKFDDIEIIDLTNSSNANGPATVTTTSDYQNGNEIHEQEQNENSNDLLSKPSNNNNENDTDSSVTTLGSFNEEIVCPHGSLSTTLNKRLVPQDAFKIFNSYFPNMKKFSSEETECKNCKMANHQNQIKSNEIKSQKEKLIDIFQNRNRQLIIEYPNESLLYIVQADFIKEWRSLIKTSKYKEIEINNKMIMCEHGKLPFNQNNIDNSMCYLVTSDEWNYISKHYKFDQEIIIQKIDDNLIFFEPEICEPCCSQNELTKILYENRKIFIRQRDEDDDLFTTEENKDEEIVNTHSKKIKLSENDETGSRVKSPSVRELRRSKRSKKCKGDLDAIVSSFSTVKEVKFQITEKTNKLVSEQHLFFNNVELENTRTLIDYKINPGDVLILKFDQNVNDDFDHANELAHMPEVGFKGTNLCG